MSAGLLHRHDTDPKNWERSPLGLLLPPKRKREYPLPVAVEFFAGAGGMGCGLHQAGFHVAAACEFNFDAAMTYMVNLATPGVKVHFDTAERERAFSKHLARAMKVKTDADGYVIDEPGRFYRPYAGSGWISGYGKPANPDDPNSQPVKHPYGCEQFFVADVRNLTGKQILDTLGLDVGDVALVTGGPPCQGFSMAGKRNVMDPRNSLVFEFTRLVCEIQPRAMVMENVPGMVGMVTPEGIPVVDAIAKSLDAGGYGEYEAMKRALGIKPGARGVTRGAKSVPGSGSAAADAQNESELDGDEQLDLFGDPP